MNTLSKDIKQKLRFIASRLPVVMQAHKEFHYLSIEEAEDYFDGNVKVEEKHVIKAGPFKGKVKVQMPVEVATNHYRALRKRFMKGGEPAVIDYIQKIKALQAATA